MNFSSYKHFSLKLPFIILFLISCQKLGVLEHTHAENDNSFSTLEILVEDKMYTSGNPSFITIHYGDDSYRTTVILFASYLNVNEVWTNIEVYNSYYSSTIYSGGDSFSYDEKEGFAGLIYDPDKDLLGKTLKIWFTNQY